MARPKGITAWNKGKPAPWAKNLPHAFKRGHTAWNTGISHTAATVEKLQLVHLGKRGEQTNNWRGGTSAKRAVYSQRRQQRLREAPGSHTDAQWVALKEKFGFMCLCCKLSEPTITLTRDHIIPVACGGSDDISNIQPLCQPCNGRKYTAAIDYIHHISYAI